MTPEGWALMTAVAVAVIGGVGGTRAATIARKTQRDTAKASPYEALAARVVQLEGRVQAQDERIEGLEDELEEQKRHAARKAVAFRSRIQVLLRHIAALDEYAELLVNIIREKRVELISMPRKPELPPDAADEL